MKKIITLFLVLSVTFLSAQTTPGEYTIKNLDINTEDSDFGTAFYGKEKVIFAAPSNNTMIVKKVWNENGQQFLDLYTGLITEDRQLIDKKTLMGEVETKFHEASVTISKDLKTLYYTSNNYYKKKFMTDSSGVNNLQIYKASIDISGKWVEIRKLPFNNSEYSIGHPALSYDETKLYFVSDMPGSYGETDIYVIDIHENGTYGAPRNLGPKVNTVGREMFPYIGEDNILYFSSDGHPGYGELDVFASKIFDNSVSQPINLDEPINSVADDFAYIIDDSRDRGFFSSNRDEGKGDDDIYSFLADPGLFIHCEQEITGVVRSESSRKLLPGAKVVLLDEDGEELDSTVADESGKYVLNGALCDTDVIVIASMKGYLNDEQNITTVNDIDASSYRLDLNLPDQFVSNKVNINTIYFDFDKSIIRPDAAKELDKVVQVMNEYPDLFIDAQSHTDSRGEDPYNMKLSERRAKSTVDYIVSKGIDASRLNYKGYGESELVNKCSNGVKCSDEEHELNRRTEFQIANETGFEMAPLEEINK